MNQITDLASNLPGIAAALELATHPPIGWAIAILGSVAMVAAATWRLRLHRIP